MHRLDDPLISVAHPNHPLRRRESVAVKELGVSGQPLIVVDWSIESKLCQLQIQSGASLVMGQWELPPHAAYAVVSHGHGIALLTRSMVLNDLRSGLLVELNVTGLGSLSWTIAMVRKRDVAVNHGTIELIRPVVSTGPIMMHPLALRAENAILKACA